MYLAQAISKGKLRHIKKYLLVLCPYCERSRGEASEPCTPNTAGEKQNTLHNSVQITFLLLSICPNPKIKGRHCKTPITLADNNPQYCTQVTAGTLTPAVSAVSLCHHPTRAGDTAALPRHGCWAGISGIATVGLPIVHCAGAAPGSPVSLPAVPGPQAHTEERSSSTRTSPGCLTPGEAGPAPPRQPPPPDPRLRRPRSPHSPTGARPGQCGEGRRRRHRGAAAAGPRPPPCPRPGTFPLHPPAAGPGPGCGSAGGARAGRGAAWCSRGRLALPMAPCVGRKGKGPGRAGPSGCAHSEPREICLRPLHGRSSGSASRAARAGPSLWGRCEGGPVLPASLPGSLQGTTAPG